MKKILLYFLLGLLLGSCGLLASKDRAPFFSRDLSQVADAVPKLELPAKSGNYSPYKVFGKQYRVLNTSKNYRQKGYASWYGKKFHGRLTSSGEAYDMFKMTAAHKHLPLPSYVKVTRTDDKRSVVLKVNDRGPFYDGRIIDLSYAAAVRLGIDKEGVAEVVIEALPPYLSLLESAGDETKGVDAQPKVGEVIHNDVEQQLDKKEKSMAKYLQLGAFRSIDSALALLEKIVVQDSQNSNVMIVKNFPQDSMQSTQALYKVRLGPYCQQQALDTAKKALIKIVSIKVIENKSRHLNCL